MNNVVLIGRLTKDPELKYSQSGKAYCRFTVAVNRDFNKDEADFINCVAWDKRAEAIAEYLKKGKRIALQGRLNVNSYDKNGETVWRTDVVVDKFEFVESNNQNKNNPVNKKTVDDTDDFPF